MRNNLGSKIECYFLDDVHITNIQAIEFKRVLFR